MRKHYLDNIRWATVLLVVLYHTIFMYNHVVTVGVVGPVTDCRWQDALQYLPQRQGVFCRAHAKIVGSFHAGTAGAGLGAGVFQHGVQPCL